MSVILFFLLLALIGTLFSMRKGEEISYSQSIPTICLCVIVLDLFSFYHAYSSAIPHGIQKIQTTVTTYYQGEELEEQTVFVDFNIWYEKDEGGGYYCFEPETFYWPDGSYTIVDEGYSATMGHTAEAEYGDFTFDVEVPKKENLKFSKTDRFLSINWLTLLYYAAGIIVPIIVFFINNKYKDQNKDETNP